MESFRIGRWEMIGWGFLPADMAVGANADKGSGRGSHSFVLFLFYIKE